jgi:hypothetical protein
MPTEDSTREADLYRKLREGTPIPRISSLYDSVGYVGVDLT